MKVRLNPTDFWNPFLSETLADGVLQFSGGCWDVFRDAVQPQVGTVHYVRLAAALGGTDWVIITVIGQTGVLRSCSKNNSVSRKRSLRVTNKRTYKFSLKLSQES